MELAGTPPAGARPVFVDSAGRRGRWLTLGGRLLAAGAACYVAVFVASLVGASWVPPVGLPGVGSAPSGQTGGARLSLPRTAKVTPAPDLTATTTSTTTPGPTRVGDATHLGVTTTTVVRSTTTVPVTTTSVRGNRPTTTTVASTTTSAPGRSGTAPGHGHP